MPGVCQEEPPGAQGCGVSALKKSDGGGEPTPRQIASRRAAERRIAIVKRRRASVELRDGKVLAAENLAAELQECTCSGDLQPSQVVMHAKECGYRPPPEDWTTFERNVALDARKAKRFAPIYLEHAHQREMGRMRAEATRPGAPAALGVVLVVKKSEPGAEAVDVVEVTSDGQVVPRDDNEPKRSP